jgi:phosphoglycerol transferase MdoB-like AlkP superfamily enzyme
VLRSKGYETAFLYGGYGYFDNMNRYFSGNGYRVVDRASVGDDDVTFANAWGACDQDLFRWTLREADAASRKDGPFHFFLMTTSNHRPYSYPEGMIDLPSSVSKRPGAVKYTDFAIGEFIRNASTRSWFNNTIFVIVADHCASVAGKTEIPVENYHIPLIIYAPGGQVKPGRVGTLMSQVDFAPTLLGLLHWSYPSRFFGHDVFKIDPEDAHALLGNYQKLGHIEQDELVVLAPKKENFAYLLSQSGEMTETDQPTAYGLRETIAFYQSASYLYRNGKYRSLQSDVKKVAAKAPGPVAASIGTRLTGN